MSFGQHLQRMATSPDRAIAEDPSSGERCCAKDIYLAAIEGDVECLKANVDMGADVNALGKPSKVWGYRFEKSSGFRAAPLHFAASYNRGLAVELLLKSGADVGLKSCSGLTARDYAQLRGYENINAMLDEAMR